jgi:hypothetical protein
LYVFLLAPNNIQFTNGKQVGSGGQGQRQAPAQQAQVQQRPLTEAEKKQKALEKKRKMIALKKKQLEIEAAELEMED